MIECLLWAMQTLDLSEPGLTSYLNRCVLPKSEDQKGISYRHLFRTCTFFRKSDCFYEFFPEFEGAIMQ